MMQFIDSHTHLDFSDFDSDRDETISSALKVGVSDIIVSATTEKRWSLLKKSISNNARCHPAYGLHPLFMAENTLEQLKKLPNWLQDEKAVAVGEIGLDYFISNPDVEAQLALFIAQLKIASDLKLPVIIHARKSLDIVLKHLRTFPDLRGSIHSFSGSEQQAKQLIDLGFYLGFGGPITYTRATRLRRLVATLPLESLLLETDSPDQPDALHYGERNEPAYIPNVASAIAELRGVSLETVAKVTTRNAQNLFGLIN
jgi:TatD DNase family protein